MNTKVGRPACARRSFIFKATVRRLDWMVMALICLWLVRYLGRTTKKSEGVISWSAFGKTVFSDLANVWWRRNIKRWKSFSCNKNERIIKEN